jgi:hypothetical protein
VWVVLLGESEHLTEVIHRALNRQLLAFLGTLHHDHNADDSWSCRGVAEPGDGGWARDLLHT